MMDLILTGTKDQALLSLVINEVSESIGPRRGFLGRTTLQKMMYFLQVTGVPMSYSFEIHYYGPYCDEISRDVEWLLADQVIQDHSTRSSYSNYRPGPNAKALIAQHQRHLQPYISRLKKVVLTLATMEPKRLELISTLHYLYRQRKAAGAKGQLKKSVISLFSQSKGQRFEKTEVAKAYDAMQSAGLVEA